MKSIIVRAHRLSFLLFILLASQSCLAQFHGKLFTTPEERAYLDALRNNFLSETRDQGFDITETGPPPLPDNDEAEKQPAVPVKYSLGGILTRSDGSRTVWLNNRPIAESSLPANMKLVVEGAQLVLRISAGANVFQLKPGQTLNMSSGQILEAYQLVPAASTSGDTPGSASTLETDDATVQRLPDSDAANVQTENVLTESVAPGSSAEAASHEDP